MRYRTLAAGLLLGVAALTGSSVGVAHSAEKSAQLEFRPATAQPLAFSAQMESLRTATNNGQQVVTKFHTRGHATAAGRQGVLGLRVLERFNVIFDYPRNRMILEPRSR